MVTIFTSFFLSFITTLIILRYKHLHGNLSIDWDFNGPQKYHTSQTPRIGGVSLVVGISSAILIKIIFYGDPFALTLLLCSIPAFTIGLLEDLTKKVSVGARLAFTIISAASAVILLSIQITHLDIPIIDYLFNIPFFGFCFSIIAITGLTNAYNIIDGFNGLSSMVGMLTLLALGYVAYATGDITVTYLSLVLFAAISGFFVWNYPKGLIFLGDGGAYIIGFWIAVISIYLCSKHKEISPWFALLINGYPITETLFTIYRRKIHQGKNPGLPDGIHFHTLIYRRILLTRYSKSPLDANARTAPYLWLLSSLSIIPCIFWWDSTYIMIGSSFFIFNHLYMDL